MKIEKYWNEKIIEWEDSMIGRRNVPFIEKIASFFRKPLKYRSEMCCSLIKPFVKGKRILELGCGSGYFALHVTSESLPDSYIGLDFSERAINRANILVEERFGRNNIFKFEVSDITRGDLQEADITIGLGLLDYLRKDEIANLFERLNSRLFLFTYSEKKMSLYRLFHIIYLRTQNCPKHFYFKKKDILECCRKKFPDVYFVNDFRLSFGCIIHNLNISSTQKKRKLHSR